MANKHWTTTPERKVIYINPRMVGSVELLGPDLSKQIVNVSVDAKKAAEALADLEERHVEASLPTLPSSSVNALILMLQRTLVLSVPDTFPGFAVRDTNYELMGQEGRSRANPRHFEKEIVPTYDLPEYGLLSLEPWFFNHSKIQQMARFMRLCRSSWGSLCQVPLGTQQGDELAIFDGLNIPFVLRQSGDAYKIVGPCYIYEYFYGREGPSGYGKKLGKIIELI